MKISARSIPGKGLDLTESLQPNDIGLEPLNIKGLKPLEVAAHVEKAGDTVLAHATVAIDYLVECARCLKEIEIKEEQEYDFDYPIPTGQELIDLGEDIRQEILLNFPVRVLCQEDCQGICAGCGVNLNSEKCKCKGKK